MRRVSNTWALVLAPGDGKRVKRLTTHGRETIPKQYCSLQRRPCLFEDAMRRAQAVSLAQHVCAVVADRHRRWWSGALKTVSPKKILVQPEDRGTAFGVLFGLLQVQARCLDAIIVLLPADQDVADEAMLARSLRIAANLASDDTEHVYLLGTKPHGADQELGYVLPGGQRRDVPVSVVEFVERPAPAEARRLLSNGALWNTFILAGSVSALLKLFMKSYASAVNALRAAIDAGTLSEFYAALEPVDFSRDILARNLPELRVLRVPSCGWRDLGVDLADRRPGVRWLDSPL